MRGPAFSVKFRFGVRFRSGGVGVLNSVQGLGQGAKFSLRVRVKGSVQGSGEVSGLGLFEFGFGVRSRAGG